MEILKNILAGVGATFLLAILGLTALSFMEAPFTTEEIIEVYEQGQPINNALVEFEVTEIVEHEMVGQSFWADDLRAAYIIQGERIEGVEVGDKMKVYVNDIYVMFGSHILVFETETAEVTKGGK